EPTRHRPLAERIPPLQQGDHLTVAEFERRYAAMSDVEKAELVNGVVYMPSPVSLDHSPPHAELMTWLGTYKAFTPGIEVGDNGTLRLQSGANRLQPDGYLRILPSFGGQSGNSNDRYVDGSPELIVEIAASSVNFDLHEKLDIYRQNNVQEYAVWRV